MIKLFFIKRISGKENYLDVIAIKHCGIRQGWIFTYETTVI